VYEGHIDHQIALPGEVDISDLQVALFRAAAGSDVLASGGVAAAPAHGVESRNNVLVCIFGGAAVLRARA